MDHSPAVMFLAPFGVMTPTSSATSQSRFDSYRVALELIRALVPVASQLRVHDRALVDQLRRAASSVALNIAEGGRRQGRDRTHLWRVAAGSTSEVVAVLDVAAAWGCVPTSTAEQARALADRVLAMLWRMTH